MVVDLNRREGSFRPKKKKGKTPAKNAAGRVRAERQMKGFPVDFGKQQRKKGEDYFRKVVVKREPAVGCTAWGKPEPGGGGKKGNKTEDWREKTQSKLWGALKGQEIRDFRTKKKKNGGKGAKCLLGLWSLQQTAATCRQKRGGRKQGPGAVSRGLGKINAGVFKDFAGDSGGTKKRSRLRLEEVGDR